MSTNHNRIRVADLEKNQPNKILKTNENGELEFSDANALLTDTDNVKLSGNQIIRGEKVFSNTNGNASLNATVSLSGASATNFSSVNDGFALYVAGFNNKKEIAKIMAIDGSATVLNLYNQKSATGDFLKAVDANNNTVTKIDKDGIVTAKSFVKTGGTNEQFLMADGSVKSGNLQAESYNALDCTTEGKTLDARQGKVLKDMIDNKTINFASDAETQINTAISEDSKVVSRSKLFNWWQWVKSQVTIITGNWTFKGAFKVDTNQEINLTSSTQFGTSSFLRLNPTNSNNPYGVDLQTTGTLAFTGQGFDFKTGGYGTMYTNPYGRLVIDGQSQGLTLTGGGQDMSIDGLTYINGLAFYNGGEIATIDTLANSNYAIDGPLSSNDLDAYYPRAQKGFKLHCLNIASGALCYEKTDTGYWIEYPIKQV